MMAEPWRAEPYAPVKGERVEIGANCIQNVQHVGCHGDDCAAPTRVMPPVAGLLIAFDMLNNVQIGDYER